MAYQLTPEEKRKVVSVAKFFSGSKRQHNMCQREQRSLPDSRGLFRIRIVHPCRQAHVEEKFESAVPRAQPYMRRPMIVVDEFTVGAIRRIVHSFYCTGKHPTQSKVFARCQQEIVDLPKLGRTTFLKLLKSIGFRCCRSKCIP